MVNPAKKKSRGIALLVVLLGIALMTLIIIDFSTTAALGYLSAANQANELRAYYLARSSIAVGLGLLAQDERMDQLVSPPYDSLNDVWAVPFPPINVDGGTASLSIVDETRKLNLNNLVDPQKGQVNMEFAAVLERLCTILNVRPELVPALVDWIDVDGITSEGGAEMDFYLGLVPPYAPRNGPMPTIGDLKMVKYVDDATFNRLLPFVTVVPEQQINVNTAPPEVLAALSPDLMQNQSLIKAIVTARLIRPFQNVSDLGNIPGMSNVFNQPQFQSLLTTRSNYFTIHGMGTFAGARKIVHGTFQRANGNAQLASWQED